MVMLNYQNLRGLDTPPPHLATYFHRTHTLSLKILYFFLNAESFSGVNNVATLNSSLHQNTVEVVQACEVNK
eukprot:m.45943 g.45943  ORF g.45943 m.45943 type:complete len:72 (-) comp15148_c0_seq7:841-1056(-)